MSRATLGALAAFLCACASLLLAPSAFATSPAPWWTISTVAQPTNFAPGDTYANNGDEFVITATNTGGGPTDGPIFIRDLLPSGVTLDPAGASGSDDAGNSVSCTAAADKPSLITCVDSERTAPLQPQQVFAVDIPVDVSSSASGSVTNEVSIRGGMTMPSPAPCSGPTGGAIACASGSAPISTTPAGYGVQSFDGFVSNPDGSVDTQAGSHPYAVTTTFWLNTAYDAPQTRDMPSGSVKNVTVNAPPGLVGSATAVPQCSQAELQSRPSPTCPTDSQVGVVNVYFAGQQLPQHQPVWNMAPPQGVPAEFGFELETTTVTINASVRTGSDYGITFTLNNIAQPLPIVGSSLTLWGVPGDPSHDPERCTTNQEHNGACAPGNAFTGTVQPLIDMPTSCDGPQTTTMATNSWQQPDAEQPASFVSHDNEGNPVGATNCGALSFTPTVSVQPDTSDADSPSGLTVDLQIPQNEDPNGLAEADLQNTVVTLPPGMSVSPSAAYGLQSCSTAQIGMNNAQQPTCPSASELGTVQVVSPLVPTPLNGGVYLAQQSTAAAPGSNPFNSTLALYIAVQGDGVLVKLAGEVTTNAQGQLVTTFENNPQLPFSSFDLTFFGGPRGALMTPESCGTFTSTATLTPYSGGAAATPSDSFTTTGGCVSGFAPTFSAGATNTQAGAYTPFVLSFARSDTDEDLAGLTVTLPAGLLANVGSVPLCSDADASAGTCPSSSQVGTVDAGAGPGPDPAFLPGGVYLTGPYTSAATGASGPYGLVVEVPAVVGPFNLGTVVVRQVIEIDPTDAHVTVISDPFPTVLNVTDPAGNTTQFPIRLKQLHVSLNRPNFMINPTSCNPMQITGTLSSVTGAAVTIASPFQVGGCASLPFAPYLKMSLSGEGRTTSGHHPTLTSILTTPGVGDVNLRSVSVTLPLSLALDPNNSQHVCAYAVAAAVHGGAVGCPSNTIIGTATAVTPVLPQPETGYVYLVQGIRYNSLGQQVRTLPTLLIPLRGLVALDLRAQTSVNSQDALVTTFSSVPDVPVTSFTLTINGGRSGLLVVTGLHRNICRAPQITTVALGGQNGALEKALVRMSTPCGAVKAAHKVRHKHRHRSKKHK